MSDAEWTEPECAVHDWTDEDFGTRVLEIAGPGLTTICVDCIRKWQDGGIRVRARSGGFGKR